VSDDREKTTEQPAAARGEARAAEIREEVAITDARRAEEETAKQEQEVQAAEKKEEKLSRAERRAREEAERAKAEADRARQQAEQAAERRPATRPAVSGANVAGPGVGSGTDPKAASLAAQPATTTPAGAVAAGGAEKSLTQRPEVMAGAAFAGAFIVARILKRIFD
jgi:hypothetical protein